MAYVLTNAAREDLVGIAAYTIERWGEAQAERYVSQLLDRCAHVAENVNAGRASDDIRKGYRRFHEGRHVIYFRRKGDIVEIVRVLHERMLPAKHLP